MSEIAVRHGNGQAAGSAAGRRHDIADRLAALRSQSSVDPGEVSRLLAEKDQRDREAFQELDYRQVFGPGTLGMAKWVGEVHDADRLPEYVSRAFHTAMQGRPGPVVIALPRVAKVAMLLVIVHLYENRGLAVDRALSEVPFGPKSWLSQLRVRKGWA